MACTPERAEQIAALVGGRIGPDAAGDLLEHVAACRACSAELDLVSDLVAAEPDVSPAAWRGPHVWLAAAALLLAAFVIWWRPWSGAPDGLATLARVPPLSAPESTLRGPDPVAEDREYRRAIEAYRKSDFAVAAGLLEQVVSRKNDAALPHLYLGVSLLQLGAVRDSLEPLRIAAQRGVDLVRERAIWYLANAHLLLEDGAAARAALEELLQLGGDYAPNARELLGALDRQR